MKMIIPKLPMRNIKISKNFYINLLEFKEIGNPNFKEYMMVAKEDLEIHFFEFKDLNPLENYGQIYIRTQNIEELFAFIKSKNLKSTKLEHKPWRQIEFSILDPDHNLITFGQNF